MQNDRHIQAAPATEAIGSMQRVFDWANMPQQGILIELLSQWKGNMTMSVLDFSILAAVIRHTSAPMDSLTSSGLKKAACKS